MNAVIETGGKQYYVEEGSIIYTEKIDAKPGDIIDLPVLSCNGAIGKPYLPKVVAKGKVIKHGKQKKVVVFKYKPKKNYSKKQGHRQPYTKLEIVEIAQK